MYEESNLAIRRVCVCRLCKRELNLRVESDSEGGKTKISLVCPKHGALGKGERYMMGYKT